MFGATIGIAHREYGACGVEHSVKSMVNHRQSRMNGINAMRVIAIFAVICIHTGSFLRGIGQSGVASAVALNLFRFGVPYFFICSGYSFMNACAGYSRTSIREITYRTVIMFLMPFFGWSLIYGVFPVNALVSILKKGFCADIFGIFYAKTAATFHSIIEHPVAFLLRGTEQHLWFIPSLAISLWFLSVVINSKAKKMLSFILLIILVFIILTQTGVIPDFLAQVQPSYKDFHVRQDVSLFFVLLGAWLALGGMKFSFAKAGILMATGALMMNAELFRDSLHMQWWQSEVISHLGTIPLALGSFMTAVLLPDNKFMAMLARVGREVKGIYFVHLLVMYNFNFLFLQRIFGPVLWGALWPFEILFLSIALVSLFKRSIFTNWLVQ
jgi:surface polysaccharide O-acyltransferase-like enzyme